MVKKSPKELESVQFQIQQLRMDKVIYAVEAILICFVSFLLLVGLPMIYSYYPKLPNYTGIVLLGVAVAAVLFSLVGNVLRFKQIRRLERELLAS